MNKGPPIRNRGPGVPEIVKERFWRMQPDGIVVLPPVGNKSGVFCILEHKRMSDVCDRYLTRVITETQYVSLRSGISETIQRQGWKVDQIRFTTGTRSVNKQDLIKNLNNELRRSFVVSSFSFFA